MLQTLYQHHGQQLCGTVLVQPRSHYTPQATTETSSWMFYLTGKIAQLSFCAGLWNETFLKKTTLLYYRSKQLRETERGEKMSRKPAADSGRYSLPRTWLSRSLEFSVVWNSFPTAILSPTPPQYSDSQCRKNTIMISKGNIRWVKIFQWDGD